MKKIFLLLFITTSLLLCQNNSPNDEKNIIPKIKVGMSQSDVKAIIGLPDAVESGFPDTDDLILREMPEQRGQLNNSSWFYHRKTHALSRMTKNKYKYFINDKEVQKRIYEDYLSEDSIYVYSGNIIAINLAWQYMKLNDNHLCTIAKDTLKTFKKLDVKGKKVYDFFKPVICIIFDRGTNVVASIKLFELLVKSGDVE